MKLQILKPAQTLEPQNKYRWCEKMDKYMPASACKKKGELKRSCRICYDKWNRKRLQLELPIEIDTDCRGGRV